MGRNEGINKRELSSSWCRLVKEEKCSVVKKWHKSGKNAVIKRLNRQTSVFSKWSTAVVQFLSLKGKLSALPIFFFYSAEMCTRMPDCKTQTLSSVKSDGR